MAQHGRYTVIRKLADGGMAEIFLANQQGHEGFQKPVVLKRILGSISADPQFRNMLIDEAHISMGLTHSNIVQVLDLGLAGGRYFMALELIDGWDLGYVLYRAKLAGWLLPPQLGIFVVTEVCRALAYAHARRTADGLPLGIVHRDISPNNVLISEQGEVKLTDFGIAKAMNKREQTGMGVVKGKVAFMSPEQALGKPIDARSDLFSLGTLLYLVVVGVKPFDAATDLETMLRVQRAELRPPGDVAPHLPADVIRIIEKAMRLEPDERYQSADAMLVDLERALRADFGGVGQTELKQYLAELQRRDGVPSIARAQPLAESQDHSSGAELLLAGNAVVLSDAQDAALAEKTELADLVAAGGNAPPRLARRSAMDLRGGLDAELARGLGLDHDLDGDLGHALGDDGTGPRGQWRAEISGREATPARSARRPVEELSFPEGAADDAPPARFRRPKRRTFPVLLALAVVVAGGLAAAHYLGLLPGMRDLIERVVERASPGTPAPAPTVVTTPPPAEAPSPRAAPPANAAPSRVERPAAAAAVAQAPPAEPSAEVTAPQEGASGVLAPAPAAPTPVVPPAEPPEGPALGATPAPPPEARGVNPRGRGERKSTRPGTARERSVFEESARRVRSLQGLEQFPPGTIQLTAPADSPPPAPPAPTP